MDVFMKRPWFRKTLTVIIVIVLPLLFGSKDLLSSFFGSNDSNSAVEEQTIEEQNSGNSNGSSLSGGDIDLPDVQPQSDDLVKVLHELMYDENGNTESASTESQTESSASTGSESSKSDSTTASAVSLTLEDIPEYSGNIYVPILNNTPTFSEDEIERAKSCIENGDTWEEYSDLDSLGRVGPAISLIGWETMPKDDREDISDVKPTGWHNKQYTGIDGGWLYNRCHLIGFQLAGENANEQNLMTGTRAFNVDAMLPFENLVADYVRATGNHVLYRVIPVFDGDDLLAHGVIMEGYSVEDSGEGVFFCVFAYNVEPNGIVELDYATGENWESE